MTDDLRSSQDLSEQNLRERTAELAKTHELLRQKDEELKHAETERLAEITQRKKTEQALQDAYAEIQALRHSSAVEGDYLGGEITLTRPHRMITGENAAMKEVLRLVRQVASTASSVLIIGETGTGKELVAESIHELSSCRHRAMVKVNCAALPSALVESELFGREKGAYTGALTRQVGRFEAAHGSTLFLDEIGELSPEVQVKLLRVLQEGWFERLGNPKPIKVDVRIIAATNRDLAAEMHKGRFREDLFYRLNVFPIKIPPLRERPEDVPVLVWAFIEEFCTRMGKKITRVPQKTMDYLQRHSWPGNVRELRNIMEHSVIITHGQILRIPRLQDSAQTASQIMTLEETEREHILRALEVTSWRIKGQGGAAGQLGMKPSTLYSCMERLGIPTRRKREQSQA